MRRKPKLPMLIRGHPLVRGLMGAWVSYEGAGEVVHDLTKRGGDGIFTNNPTWDTGGSGLRGSRMPSVDFSAGVTRMLSCGTGSALNPTAALTFFQYLYPTSLAGTSGEQWSLGRDSNAGGRSFAWGPTTGGGAKLQINGADEFGAGSGIVINSWHSLALTGSAATNFIGYVNAIAVAGSAWTQPNVTTNPLTIGARLFPAFERGFIGLIAVTYIWNRALFVSEIRQLHNDPYQLVRWKSVLVVATLAPPGLTTIRLNWTNTAENADDVSIERKTDAGAFGEIDTVGAGIETYDDGPIDDGHTYIYRVKATSAALGDSEYSNEAAETV